MIKVSSERFEFLSVEKFNSQPNWQLLRQPPVPIGSRRLLADLNCVSLWNAFMSALAKFEFQTLNFRSSLFHRSVIPNLRLVDLELAKCSLFKLSNAALGSCASKAFESKPCALELMHSIARVRNTTVANTTIQMRLINLFMFWLVTLPNVSKN